MADLIFADSYNMVAYLEKSKDNADFAEIVDFLNASPIRYALTVSLTVYVSYIEQFRSTAKIKTVNNETQIRAKVDGKTIVITESSVRRDLHFNDEDGITCFTNTEIFENLQLMGKTKSKVTEIPQYSKPTNLDADEAVHKERGDSGISSCGSPRCQKAMGDTIGQTRVLDLENVKDAQALEIKKLKKRVKKLERKNKSRTPQPKRRVYKPRVESSEESLDQEETIELVEDKGSAEKGVSAAEDKDSTADPVTTAGETITTVSVNPEDSIVVDVSLADNVTLTETLMAIRSTKDKGKGIIQEPEKLVKVKGKDQIEYDVDKRTEQYLVKKVSRDNQVKDDAEMTDLEACLEIVPNDDSIVLIYKLFSAMLDDFDRPDVLDLYRLVKERFETTSPKGYDRLLSGDLITLFNPSEEDEIWKTQQDTNIDKAELVIHVEFILLMDSRVHSHASRNR
ncbi:hypothetical protein Tco_0589155 [Tanacetum coccineum]